MATHHDPQREGHQGHSGMADQAKEKAGEAAGDVRRQVTSQLDEQKDRVSEQLGTTSSALRQTSNTLREENEDVVAHYMEGAARQVDRFSGYLRTHSVSELFSEAERYARRQPSVFIGGAMLAGFLGARFLKSSSRSHGDGGRHYRSRRSSMGEREWRQEEALRRPPRQSEGYAPVHGTSGAEMPERSEAQGSSPGRTTGTPASAHEGIESEE